ncbi:MAG TPA: hypothetical protein VLB73_02470 [Patescibacteria group bacterium]|nr:hypothetical protein [Patescibacteria group bacterium]
MDNMTVGKEEPQGKDRTPGTGNREVNGRRGEKQNQEPGFGGLEWTEPRQIQRGSSTPTTPKPAKQTGTRG